MTAIAINEVIKGVRMVDCIDHSLSYYNDAYRFTVAVRLLSQDVATNSSHVRVSYKMEAVRAYYSYSSNSLKGVLTVDGVQRGQKIVKSISNHGSVQIALWEGDIVHGDDGNRTFAVVGAWTGTGGYAPESNTITISVDLPQILRASTIAVTPEVLTAGGALNITVTPYVSSPTWKWITSYEVGGQTIALDQTKGQVTTYTAPTYPVSYNDIVALIGTKTTAEIIVSVETFNGEDSIGTQSAKALVQTGVLPLSLFDDLDGNVGVSFGTEAKEAGFDFENMPVYKWFRFQVGEVYRVGINATFAGMVTGSASDIIFSLQLPYSAEGRTVTINSLTLNVRGVNGSYIPSTGYNFTSYATATVDADDPRWVRITCHKSSAWTNATNNTPVVITPATATYIELEFN